MTSIDPASSIAHRASGRADVWAFSATLFLSAFLLFAIQPIFAKMVLPTLGGAPGVWSVAMVFFQTVLLAGYGYAHFLSSKLPSRVAVIVHLAVFTVAVFFLPFGVTTLLGRPPAENAELWLAGLFAVSVGVPFFAVSANGPLLQAWFARTGHPHASDPYFLYGASNIGSFFALISYPFLVEPLVGVHFQAQLWMGGFLALMVAIAGCGILMMRAGDAAAAVSATVVVEESPAPTLTDKAIWVGLAMIPSGLLVAVTAHISTDIATAPFLWVLPLALFLLTFVITFQREPILKHRWMVVTHPILMLTVAVILVAGLAFNLFVMFALHLGVFFVTAMLCHGELVRRRPGVKHLTAFYLWMSFGGVVGGVFAGLIAPNAFNSVVEYPILLIASLAVLAAALWPKTAADQIEERRDYLKWAGIAIVVGTLLLAPLMAGFDARAINGVQWLAFAAITWGLLMLFRSHHRRFVPMVTVLLAVLFIYEDRRTPDTGTVRSFFGVHKLMDSPDGQFRLLVHGTTIHGAERIRTEDGKPYEGAPQPATYYHHAGPMVGAIKAVREARGGVIPGVHAIGLGAGSLSCHAKREENWVYYEIDPEVVEIARDPSKFRFLSSCAPDMKVVLGDARLTLADQPAKSAGVVVVDAFSSDSIPVHLLTREALQLYLSRTDDNGVIVFHISNRHMELASVVAALATSEGLVSYAKEHAPSEAAAKDMATGSVVAVVARSTADLGALPSKPGWTKLEPVAGVDAWTDDYSNVLGTILRGYLGGGITLTKTSD